ncbi:MAG: DivIVA domain-containing protein [Actinobacteria bacterium]|nr:DivIVA domain-containing protein [Actinomycetota bacterium]
MALTPEEIHNKTFNETTFKKGYDQIEVDDFLDELEITVSALVKEVDDLRSATRGEIPASVTAKLDELIADNENLWSELAQAQSEADSLRKQNAELASASSQGDSAVADQLSAQLQAVQQELSAAQQVLAALENEKAALVAQVDQLSAHNEELSQGAAVAPISASDASVSAVRMLELAQRTADETVASARIEGEQFLSEASSQAERIMSETTSNVANITREFEGQKANLERKIEELRAYEREYRGRLRSYLEGQLRELEAKKLDVELESGPADDEY